MKVIRETYRDVDQEKPCPSCHAAPLMFCVNQITGEFRRVPCARRPRIKGVEAAIGNYLDAEVVDERELDFSEPRHVHTRSD